MIPQPHLQPARWSTAECRTSIGDAPKPSVARKHFRGEFRGRGHFRGEGYALVVTLVFLAIMAVTITGMARLSLMTAMDAKAAEESLQVKWAQASCRDILFPTLRDQLDTELAQWRSVQDEQGEHLEPPRSIRVQFTLGSASGGSMGNISRPPVLLLSVRVDDQQAMPQLDNLYRRYKREGHLFELSQRLEQLAPGQRVDLRPTPDTWTQGLGFKHFASWQQVFPGLGRSYETTTTSGDILRGTYGDTYGSTYGGTSGGPATELTLWGDGRLNLWTASDDALRWQFEDRLGRKNMLKLLELRDEQRQATTRDLVDALDINPSNRAALRLGLTDESKAYGMWLTLSPIHPEDTNRTRPSSAARGISGRATTTLTIDDQTAPPALRTRTYKW